MCTRSTRCARSRRLARGILISLASWLAGLAVLAIADPVRAHDLERTRVVLTFDRDGSFVLDVSHDPKWLELRLASVPGPFVDRVVLWVDGREIRAESVEFIPGVPLDTYRLRGRMPIDARQLRWYYGLVIDPYPLTIRKADGRIVVEDIAGDAWSRPIDIGGQFAAPDRWPLWVVVGMLIAGIWLRVATRRGPRKTAADAHGVTRTPAQR